MTPTTTGRSGGWCAGGLAFLAFVLLAARPAHAQDDAPAAPAAAADDDDDLTEAGTPRSPPTDTRRGNVLASLHANWVAPAGSIATGAEVARLVSAGPSFGGTLGIGISRYVVLEASASYSLLAGADVCLACKGRSFDLGLGFAYHLAQGIAMDPWVSFGAGWRSSTFTFDDPASDKDNPALVGVLPVASGRAYQGLDVARIALGADFYPVPKLGFGPFVEADFGTYLARPAPTPKHGETVGPADAGGATYAFFQVGLRIAFDPMRGSLSGGTHGAKTARLAR